MTAAVPAVSVLIPAFNSAATIARALDSVFAQSLDDYEIIVVDDGSKDDLEQALAPYGARLTFIRQVNSGASAARNAGARAARGRFLAFLDADDFWHERKLELQCRAFELNPQTVLCWTLGKHCAPGAPSPVVPIPAGKTPEPKFSNCFQDIFLEPYLGTPGVMIPRELFIRLGGFREDLKCAEDVDLWLRTAYSGATALIPWPLFYVVESATSLTATNREGTYFDNLRVIEDFCRAHADFAKDNRMLVRRVISRVYEDWGSSVLVAGLPKRAAGLFGKSLLTWPRARASLLFAKACVEMLLGGSRSLK